MCWWLVRVLFVKKGCGSGEEGVSGGLNSTGYGWIWAGEQRRKRRKKSQNTKNERTTEIPLQLTNCSFCLSQKEQQ
jgi:hypothetical protein